MLMRPEDNQDQVEMELKQQQKLTREEFERIASEMRALVGDKLKNHKNGDAEPLLFKKQ
jgi:hypothetical protein